MREILFRGKDPETGIWYEGQYIHLRKTTYCFAEDYEDLSGNDIHQIVFERMTDWGLPNQHLRVDVDPSTVGQYTGLSDRAGIKAFEHDCIRQLHGDAIGVIRYGEYNNAFDGNEFPYHVGFYVDWVSGENKDFLRKDLCYWLNCVKIIGNAHDNPELLKGGTECKSEES